LRLLSGVNVYLRTVKISVEGSKMLGLISRAKDEYQSVPLGHTSSCILVYGKQTDRTPYYNLYFTFEYLTGQIFMTE
jgi:hypothetical protein